MASDPNTILRLDPPSPTASPPWTRGPQYWPQAWTHDDNIGAPSISRLAKSAARRSDPFSRRHIELYEEDREDLWRYNESKVAYAQELEEQRHGCNHFYRSNDDNDNDNKDVGEEDEDGDSASLEIYPSPCPPLTPEPPTARMKGAAFILIACAAQLLSLSALNQTVAPVLVLAKYFDVEDYGNLSWFSASYSMSVGTFILPAGMSPHFTLL